MDVHKNARLTFHGRDTTVRRVLEAGQTPKAAAFFAMTGKAPRRPLRPRGV